jgi:hypothetical protein
VRTVTDTPFARAGARCGVRGGSPAWAVVLVPRRTVARALFSAGLGVRVLGLVGPARRGADGDSEAEPNGPCRGPVSESPSRQPGGGSKWYCKIVGDSDSVTVAWNARLDYDAFKFPSPGRVTVTGGRPVTRDSDHRTNSLRPGSVRAEPRY